MFGERLKELRLDRNLTQKQLGDIFNVKQTRISDWEAGSHEPGFQMLIDFAVFFNVSVGQLLGAEEY